MLSFYMDHHVHQSITDGLRRRGVDVLTSFEDGKEEADDEALLERATGFSFLRMTIFSESRLTGNGPHASSRALSTRSSNISTLVGRLSTWN